MPPRPSSSTAGSSGTGAAPADTRLKLNQRQLQEWEQASEEERQQVGRAHADEEAPLARNLRRRRFLRLALVVGVLVVVGVFALASGG